MKKINYLFILLCSASVVACGDGMDQKEQTQTKTEKDSVEKVVEPGFGEIKLDVSTYDSLIASAKLLTPSESALLDLDTVSFENYLVNDFGVLGKYKVKLIISAIETQQFGYLVFSTRSGKFYKKILCYEDDQVEGFRSVNSVINEKFILFKEMRSYLECECSYVKTKIDLRFPDREPQILQSTCDTSNCN